MVKLCAGIRHKNSPVQQDKTKNLVYKPPIVRRASTLLSLTQTNVVPYRYRITFRTPLVSELRQKRKQNCLQPRQ